MGGRKKLTKAELQISTLLSVSSCAEASKRVSSRGGGKPRLVSFMGGAKKDDV